LFLINKKSFKTEILKPLISLEPSIGIELVAVYEIFVFLFMPRKNMTQEYFLSIFMGK
jgi:hypothetical protein